MEKMAIKKAQKKLTPIHPGEILAEEFLAPLDLTQSTVAKAISLPSRRISEIVRGQRRISADAALRIAQYFGTSERFWINLQVHFDLEVERDRLGTRLAKEVVARNRAS